jgi:hypothetical protein
MNYFFFDYLVMLNFSTPSIDGLEVVNPEGGTEDAAEEAKKGRWKDEVYSTTYGL